MPRNLKLTWQPGTSGRAGRWRKKYKGKAYHFPGGGGKSDRNAYQSALADWEKLKVQLDEAAPKPNEGDYKREIAAWEQVIAWSRQHGEEGGSDVAAEKVARLRRMLSKRKPPPVSHADTLDGHFDPRVRHPDRHKLYEELAETVLAVAEPPGAFDELPGYAEYRAACDKFLSQLGGNNASANTVVDPSNLDIDQPDPLVIEQAVWRDRLEVMQRSVATESTVSHFVEQFIADKSASAEAGDLSVARVYALQLHLGDFADWLGNDTDVKDISAQSLIGYRLELLKGLKGKGWSRTTANDRLTTVKSFVRWLWQIEAIPTLPRIMDGKSTALNIGVAPAEIVTFEKKEISTLLENASDRTKLYILLMLNCGMTQKDIADLQHSEVDWKAGRITRKRSKTRKHENVPTVCYRLWPETLRLLKQERNRTRSGDVLSNENGSKILRDEISSDGKYKKSDNVKSAFDRLRRKTGIKKPLKSLKKTSATLIRGNEKFNSLESLFLGHSGKTISDRHYAQPPQQLLDDAIAWLATEYGL